MKITKRQLRRIIREVHPDYQGLPQSDIDYYEMADDYAMWSKKNGHVTPAASSVMATYFLEKGLEDDHEKHEMLGKAFKVSHDDIMREIELQMADQKAAEEILSTRMGDYSSSPHRKKTNEGYKMKITTKQLRRIIKEETAKVLKEVEAGKPVIGRSAGSTDHLFPGDGDAEKWMAWGEQNYLDDEHDNDGQLIYYTSDADLAAQAESEYGGDVQRDSSGQFIIYTGIYR